MKSVPNTNPKSACLVAGLVTIAALVLSGCAGDSTMRSSGAGANKGGASTGIESMTGGAEARPTADPGVTPGTKPGDR